MIPVLLGVAVTHEVDDVDTDAMQKTLDRIDYRLTFSASLAPREFSVESEDGSSVMIQGDDLPDAYEHEGSPVPGDWTDSGDPDDPIREAFAIAVHEAVHEVLEWFLVDGERMANPHQHEHRKVIPGMTKEFARRLYGALNGQEALGAE